MIRTFTHDVWCTRHSKAHGVGACLDELYEGHVASLKIKANPFQTGIPSPDDSSWRWPGQLSLSHCANFMLHSSLLSTQLAHNFEYVRMCAAHNSLQLTVPRFKRVIGTDRTLLHIFVVVPHDSGKLAADVVQPNVDEIVTETCAESGVGSICLNLQPGFINSVQWDEGRCCNLAYVLTELLVVYILNRHGLNDEFPPKS